MVKCAVGDYVTFIHTGRRKRGVVTSISMLGVWVVTVAICWNRKWIDTNIFKYRRVSRKSIINILPAHKAMVYKLSGNVRL
jgi:hypothetical protein